MLLPAILVSLSGPAQAKAGENDAPLKSHRNGASVEDRNRQIRETLEDDPRFQIVLANHPDLRLDSRFVDEYHCWIVEFLIDDGELGMASLSPDAENILEFSIFEDKETVSDNEVRKPSGERPVWAWLLPEFGPAALFWLGLLLTALVMADFRNPVSLRNLDTISLVALVPFLIGIWERQHLAFTAIYLIVAYLFGRMIFEVFRKRGSRFSPNLPAGALILLIAFAYGYHVAHIRSHGVDDASVWATFGAQHIMDNGHLPYGRYDDGDTYGPVLYLAHVPLVAAVEPVYVRDGQTVPIRPNAFEEAVPYEAMRFGAVKLSAALCDALVLLGLILIGYRCGNLPLGLTAAAVYAVSPYLAGPVGGLAWISHLFPTAATLLALCWIRRPVVSGLLLATGAWSLYYPAFLLPLWAGYHWGRWRRMAMFIATVALFSFAMVIMLIAGIEIEGKSLGAIEKLRLFLDNTVGFQAQSSWFGFWAQHPKATFIQPVVQVVYAVFCLALFVWPRRKRVHDVAALSAAVIIGTQLWKSHGGGTYILWYLPFLILAFLAGPEIENLDGSAVSPGQRTDEEQT